MLKQIYSIAAARFVTALLATSGAIGTLGLTATSASAASINLNTWTAEGGGVWQVDPTGTSVVQTINAPRTFFTSDLGAKGLELSGKIKVETSEDNDFIGFALGFNQGDLTNAAADFLVIDWKKGNHSSPYGTALTGLAVSRITGVLNVDEYWSRTDLPTTSGTFTELARGINLGNVGWNSHEEYDIKFNFTDDNLKVYINDRLEFNVDDDFSNIDGNFAFYNQSQQLVRYSRFQADPLPPQDVPEPITGLVVTAGLGGVALRRAKKSKKS